MRHLNSIRSSGHGLVLLLATTLAAGCDLLPFQTGEGEEEREDPMNQIDTFMQRFEEAGKARGIDVSDPNADVLRSIDSVVIAVCSKLVYDGTEYCGYVPRKGYGYTDSLLISLKEACWFGVSDHVREALVFHELGHSVLGRRRSTEPNLFGLLPGRSPIDEGPGDFRRRALRLESHVPTRGR